MAVLNKANIPPPSVPKEVVEVPELGGEVIVRGLLLSDRIRLFSSAQSQKTYISHLLSCTVVDNENTPIYSIDEWESFGARNFEASLALFKTAKTLSGLDVEVNEKKS